MSMAALAIKARAAEAAIPIEAEERKSASPYDGRKTRMRQTAMALSACLVVRSCVADDMTICSAPDRGSHWRRRAFPRAGQAMPKGVGKGKGPETRA
jgi:hypothetical protein